MSKHSVVAILLVMMALTTAFGQEETDLGEVARQSARSLANARHAYDRAEYSEVVYLLKQLLEELGPVAAGSLPIEEEEIREDALRLRGISYYNLGQFDAATGDFESLVRLKPDFQLDSNLLSPKIIAAFEEIRNEVTGLLTVSSEPPGAEVRLGSALQGVTPLDAVRVVSGRYPLLVEKRGFAPAENLIDVVPGQANSFDFALVRNARSVNIMTAPAGARIIVDGDELGTTSGTPPPSYEATLLDFGLDPAGASAPFSLPFLMAGEHIIRVEKECFRTFEATFHVDLDGADLPQELEPIVLRRSTSTVRFESTPEGAEVHVNGQYIGRTPVEVDDLCAGDVQVRMEKAGVGKWWDSLSLRSGAREEIQAVLRPALASLGAVREPGLEDPRADTWEEFLADVVNRQTGYLAVRDGSESGDLSPARMELYRTVEADAGHAPVLGEELRQALEEETGADLLLVAVPISRQEAEFLLYSLTHGHPDRIHLARRDDATADALAERFSEPTTLTETWSGLFTVETAGSDFPYVLGLAPDGGAATTVQSGDRIRAVEGKPIVSRRELESAFLGRSPGSQVAVTVGRGGEVAEVMAIATETANLPPPGDRGHLANRYLVDMRSLRARAPDAGTRALAATGIGLAYLMVGEAAMALEHGFELADLPDGPGVSAGTVAYLKGISQEAAGGRGTERARAFFSEAAKSAEATLWRDDGPRVAPLAAARLAGGR